MSNLFNVTSGKMVCSDPCYELGTWCQGVVENVKNGEWEAHTDISDEGDWGKRIAELKVVHVNANFRNAHWEHIGDFGVDSGQFGFFDAKQYRRAVSVKDMPKYDFGSGFLTDDKDPDGDEWYRACCDLTLSKENWGLIPNGVVSSSGYGDGMYPVYGLKDDSGQYVAFQVTFISDEEPEDADDPDDADDN